MRTSVHVILVAGCLAVAAAAQNGSPAVVNRSAPQASAPVPPPQISTAVQQARPLTPSQRMPAPPRVSYNDNKLTVIANNSTVQDVINAIHGATGTKFEVNGGPTQERLFGQFGPGPVNSVLEQILRGSGFNYILVSSRQSPQQVQTAMLMAKSNEASTPAVARQPQPQPEPQQPEQGNADQPPDNPPEEEQPQQPEPPPAPEIQQPNPQAAPQSGEQQQPKTPEQLLQELQRLQQLRMQQQQQQQYPQQNPQGGSNPPQD
jgi:hypothetical protein